jgi:hypothetical protein
LRSTAAVVVAGVEKLAGERRGGTTVLAGPGLSALVERERADAERDGAIGGSNGCSMHLDKQI